MTPPRRLVATLLAAVIGTLLGTVALTGCGIAHDDQPQVVATTNILGDVVGRLVGDQATVMTLMKPNADPHSFAVSAREAGAMRNADLIVYNGLGLEEGIEHHVRAAHDDGVPIVEAGGAARPITFRTGETSGAADSHFWTDPTRMRDAVRAVSHRLAEIDGVDRARLSANTEAYLSELNDLDEWMRGLFAAIPQDRRKLVTNHHVFGYLADRYGFEVIGAVVPSGTTLASPSSSDLASLATAIRTTAVSAIFVDTSQPDRLAKALAAETRTAVAIVPLYSESLDERGTEADSYIAMMRTNASRISSGLSR